MNYSRSEIGMRVPRIDVSPSVGEEVGGDVGNVLRVVVLQRDPRRSPRGIGPVKKLK